MTAIELLRPWWLAVIPVVALLGLFLSRRATALGAWDKTVDTALLAAMDRLGRVVHGPRRRLWLPPLTAALIALALVGPATERRAGTAFRNLDGIVIAIDLSRSMVEGGRLQDALIAARLIARSAGSRQVALIVSAGDAYLASPFTSDAAALGRTIALLDGEVVPDPGSRPERALSLARRVLADADILYGDVVLVTDGGGIEQPALDEARLLAETGGPVSTIYVASTPPGADRAIERSVVDGISQAGGGASGDLIDPSPVVQALDQGLRRRLEKSGHSVLMRIDYGRYLLLLALVPAFFLFRRAG